MINYRSKKQGGLTGGVILNLIKLRQRVNDLKHVNKFLIILF